MHSIHLIRFWKQKEVINLCNQAQKSMTFAIMVCWVTALTVSWCFRVKSVWNGLLWAALGSWVLKWEVYTANTMLSCGNKSASVVRYLEGQVPTLLLHYNQVPKENGWSTKGHKQILTKAFEERQTHTCGYMKRRLVHNHDGSLPAECIHSATQSEQKTPWLKSEWAVGLHVKQLVDKCLLKKVLSL